MDCNDCGKNNCDIVEDVCELDGVGKEEFSAAWNNLHDYFMHICVNPKSYGAEHLLFWMESGSSRKIMAACLAKLLWMLLNDDRAVREALSYAGAYNAVDEFPQSEYGIKHDKNIAYWDALGVPEKEIQKFIADNESIWAPLFYAGKIAILVRVMEEFLRTTASDKIKAGIIHVIFRETAKQRGRAILVREKNKRRNF